MGRADYWKAHDANGICDRCGQKFKRSELQREWTGLYVCGESGNGCFELRHPQDSLKAMRDRQTVPNARPDHSPYYLDTNEVTEDDL